MGLARRTVEIVRGDEKLQRRLLQVVFDRFHQTGEWPSVDVLRYELDLEDDDLDVATVGQRLEPALGRLESGYQARASLTIHGLALCSGADQELTDTLQTMRYAYARFRANGPGARFDSEGLSRDLGFDAIRIRRTYELIQWFPGIGGGGAVSPDEWYREILPDITRFKHVESVADLLAAVPHPGGPTVPASGSLGSKRAPRRKSAKGAGPSVFVSYAHEDRQFVLGLADALHQRGCRVWVDEGEMRVGDVLIDRIAAAIDEMEFLLAIVSEASVQSSWCQRELSIAISGALEQAKVKVLPVRLGRTALPVTLSGIYSPRVDPAAIDQTADKLVADMRSHKSGQPKPRFSGTVPGVRGPGDVEPTQPSRSRSASRTPTNPDEPIRILGIDEAGVTQPKNDGTRGSGLYRVPLRLNQTPPGQWGQVFRAVWDHPPQFTTMHRPGIASVSGDRIILDGTTVEEIERYHAETLRHVIPEVDRQLAELEAAKRVQGALEESERRAHEEAVREAAKRVSFE